MEGNQECKNCGAQLSNQFCGVCGQAANVSVPSLWALIHDLLDSVFDLDSRTWRSLLRLFLKPGELTREYLAGRRIRYLPPVRMYLVASLTFFLIVSLFGDPSEDDALIEVGDIPTCELGSLPGPFNTPELRGRLETACSRISADSGNSLAQGLMDNLPAMMFLFIPLAAFIMKMLYPLSKRKYVEHLLFLFHFHAFFFVVAILTWLISAIGGGTVANVLVTAIWVYVPVYLFLAMRRVYGQSRAVTAFKYLLLFGGYSMCLGFTLVIGVIFTAMRL